MPPKSKLPPVFEELEEFELLALSDSLRLKGGRDLAAKAILDLARYAGLTLEELQRAKEALPPFSSAVWEETAVKFKLDKQRDASQLDPFSVPHASLPPSFHKQVMLASVQWLDVYQERGSQKREVSRVRLMDAWHVPVCALFKGRVVDLLETLMPETPETSGGAVEHEVYMIEGIILIVVELKVELNERDNAAQVLSELASAYKINSLRELDPQPPVYAILTDLRIFQFFCYDGSKFTLDEDIYVRSRTRRQFLDGMGDVAEKLFSVILHGFISTLQAIVSRSTKRGSIDDVSDHNSTAVGEATPEASRKPGMTRPSLSNWSQALIKATEAQRVLVGCDHSSMKAWENDGECGLRLLEESVAHLHKIGSGTDWSDSELNDEISSLLNERRVKAVNSQRTLISHC